jgi:hypothetical protein
VKSASTFLILTANRIVRVEEGGARRDMARPAGTTADAVRAALASGGKPGVVWVLSDQVFTQRITLSPAQVAGLTPEQLGRALAFEIEPFSGIPVADGAVGFREEANGAFAVIQMPRAELDAISRGITGAGGRLGGIFSASGVPEDQEALLAWVAGFSPEAQPGIAPPVPAPSPNRFLFAGIAFEAAAIVLLLLGLGWTTLQRRSLERRNAELAAAARELAGANRQNETLRQELAALAKDETLRERVRARRGALLAVLQSLASTRSDEVVVCALAAEGPSSLVVSGLALEAGAVDELSIVLGESLRGSGWSAQPRHKNGLRNLPSGGPWEFSLALTHEEAARAQAVQLSQRESP